MSVRRTLRRLLTPSPAPVDPRILLGHGPPTWKYDPLDDRRPEDVPGLIGEMPSLDGNKVVVRIPGAATDPDLPPGGDP